MDSKKFSLPGCLALLIFLSGCTALQVAQDVQLGRSALQTGRPEVALGYILAAQLKSTPITPSPTPRVKVC
jgi:hypothetical protein